MTEDKAFETIDNYIDSAQPEVKEILQNIRIVISKNVPTARECISYRMPAFKHERPFIYFAAFKKHIGVYPPINDDKLLINELAPYRNEKGNLRFPLNESIPYEVIGKVAKALFKQNSK